ncbi:hypothetical protein CPHO_00325 [Corynebacterium phocae]|uniref:Secreted protein n=1 Tax=Corynebacterium phocae TaxID=161895 RepID=A0A1L7D0Z3_9CORY|nr:hypothetical protein [Corynebacterium phocae]APT91631.1 hypothetical protein CPHO_00325 [Corynebacterium phocae]KAA8720709.1 hypothetical protein F4V58_12200 [Corynebacterium phocae]
MSFRFRVASVMASVVVAGAALAAPAAGASTFTESYPETPATNVDLPVVHTYHGSDHLKANVLNPRPICNPWEDKRTVVYKVSDLFMPVGTISTTNQTNKEILLQQSLSKSQSISVTVNGSRTETVGLNAGYAQKGGSAGISYSLATAMGASASYSLTWNAGQNIGPYPVPANHTGEATYGFRVLNMTGTQQFCKLDGTWSSPTAWSALQPIKNEVRVKLYDKLSDSWAPNEDAQNTHEVDKDPKKDAEVVAENETTVAVPENATTDLDLRPYLTTSGMKAPGFAGTVALHLENVGTERYYGDFPAVQFRVDVKTAEGPQGVDRLITPRSSNGAHIRDLGFDAATSTRSFEVTLANPINAGRSQHVANLDFGDGLTGEGRLKNYIEVTQISRLDGDNSGFNDQHVDSRSFTLDDFGSELDGLF